MRVVHESPKYPCDICDFVTNKNAELKRHKKEEHTEVRTKRIYETTPIKVKIPPVKKETPILGDKIEGENRILLNHLQKPEENGNIPQEGIPRSENGEPPSKKRKTNPEHKFACDVCDYTCKHASNLRSHKESKHEGIRSGLYIFHLTKLGSFEISWTGKRGTKSGK